MRDDEAHNVYVSRVKEAEVKSTEEAFEMLYRGECPTFLPIGVGSILVVGGLSECWGGGGGGGGGGGSEIFLYSRCSEIDSEAILVC